MTEDDKSLKNLVNASGFAFQLAIESLVRATQQKHQWDIAAKEHPWKKDPQATDSFIDLVLQKGIMRLVIECKRVRESGAWVFLCPEDSFRETKLVRYLWTHSAKGRDFRASYSDVAVSPSSVQSSFCVVRGQGEGDRPMLERIAGELLQAEEAVASQQHSLDNGGEWDCTWMFFPVIVTTAHLHTCEFSTDKVSLDAGDISDGVFTTVPLVRFKKAFTQQRLVTLRGPNFREVSRASERTVLVVNASSLVDVLTGWSVQEGEGWPWLP